MIRVGPAETSAAGYVEVRQVSVVIVTQLVTQPCARTRWHPVVCDA